VIYLLVFLAALAVDTIPVFAPPAWIVLVFLVIKFQLNPWRSGKRAGFCHIRRAAQGGAVIRALLAALAIVGASWVHAQSPRASEPLNLALDDSDAFPRPE
jgi:hypothetical protein